MLQSLFYHQKSIAQDNTIISIAYGESKKTFLWKIVTGSTASLILNTKDSSKMKLS